MNHAKRVDSNQKELVKFLRENGFSVHLTHMVGEGFPDAVVGGDMPCPFCHNYFWQERLLEIKTKSGKLTPVQISWWERWNGQATIARNWKELESLFGFQGRTAIWEPRAPDQDADQEGGAARSRQDARNPDGGRARRVSQKHRPSSLPDPGNPGTN